MTPSPTAIWTSPLNSCRSWWSRWTTLPTFIGWAACSLSWTWQWGPLAAWRRASSPSGPWESQCRTTPPCRTILSAWEVCIAWPHSCPSAAPSPGAKEDPARPTTRSRLPRSPRTLLSSRSTVASSSLRCRVSSRTTQQCRPQQTHWASSTGCSRWASGKSLQRSKRSHWAFWTRCLPRTQTRQFWRKCRRTRKRSRRRCCCSFTMGNPAMSMLT
mmetsp:Transcript_15531/g.35274  ORF Transcript_15531/g.35274 Transcript_15531/m.35274 type:complete len:215 (+) Transcript_15531:454-1098(+)